MLPHCTKWRMKNSTPPFWIFPAVHENELSERNKRRGPCNFSQFVPKKIRRRGSKKTSDLITAVTTSTGKDDFENPSHQALQPRPTLDALLVSLNFASIKNVFDSVFYSHFKLKFFKHVLHKLYSGVLHVRKRSGKKPWNFILSHGKLACIKKVKENWCL